jgi:hypothetical protein
MTNKQQNKSYMKTKLSILILFLSLGATSLFADETNPWSSSGTLNPVTNDPAKWQIVANVGEEYIAKVEVGQNIIFDVDALPGKQFKGTVKQISDTPTPGRDWVTYDVLIDVSNPDAGFKPGMSAGIPFSMTHSNPSRAVASSNTTFIKQRLLQIDMDVDFKQYEKISSELADAKLNLATLDDDASPEVAKLKMKITVLLDQQRNVREEIIELANKSDAESTKQ